VEGELDCKYREDQTGRKLFEGFYWQGGRRL